jgi:hypothetical protein
LRRADRAAETVPNRSLRKSGCSGGVLPHLALTSLSSVTSRGVDGRFLPRRTRDERRHHGRVDQVVCEVWAECTVLDRRRVAHAAVSRTTWSSPRIAASEYRRAAVHRNFGEGDVFARLGSAFRSRGTGDTERGSGERTAIESLGSSLFFWEGVALVAGGWSRLARKLIRGVLLCVDLDRLLFLRAS